MNQLYNNLANAIEDEANELISLKIRDEGDYNILLIKCNGIFCFPGCGESSKEIEDFWKVFSSAESIDIFTDSKNAVCVELMIKKEAFE